MSFIDDRRVGFTKNTLSLMDEANVYASSREVTANTTVSGGTW
jgi:hypothetical protein